MNPPTRRRPLALRLLIGVLVFQGLAAVPPGAMLVIDPSGGLIGMPLGLLANSPFTDFCIPGLVLGVGLGLGAWGIAASLAWQPAAAWLGRLNPVKACHWSWSGAVVFGVSLMAWIVVQVALIGATSWLQPFIFSLGVIIAGLPLLPSVRAALAARE